MAHPVHTHTQTRNPNIHTRHSLKYSNIFIVISKELKNEFFYSKPILKGEQDVVLKQL